MGKNQWDFRPIQLDLVGDDKMSLNEVNIRARWTKANGIWPFNLPMVAY